MIERTWPDLLSCRGEKEPITDQEDRINKLLSILGHEREPKFPRVAEVFAAREYHKGILWWSEDGKRHLYLLGDLQFHAAECISFLELDVFFAGTIAQLRGSKLSSRMQRIPPGKRESIAVLKVNTPLIGSGGRNLQDFFFPVPIIFLPEPDKRLSVPKFYIKEEWRSP